MSSSSQQQRRRAKERARERTAARSAHAAGAAHATGTGTGTGQDAGAAHAAGASGAPPSLDEEVVATLTAALRQLQAGNAIGLDLAAAVLAEGDGTPAWERTAEHVLTRALTVSTLPHLWQRGWEPADVVRVVRRRLDQVHADLVGSAIASELGGYARDSVDPRWFRQLEALDATVWWPADSTLLTASAGGDPELRLVVVRIALQVIDVITRLPTLEALSRPPGTAHAFPAAAEGAPERAVDERILHRVRALLAKAESTTYPAEAETFTAGAQALMARHSIDHALLAPAGRPPSDGPGGRRIGIDNPYEAPKAIAARRGGPGQPVPHGVEQGPGLLHRDRLPGRPGRRRDALHLVAGPGHDRDDPGGGQQGPIGRSRTRSFRQSFLLSYADRIRERLTETTSTQTAARRRPRPGGARLLPVLAARHEEVDQAVTGLFPHVRRDVGGPRLRPRGLDVRPGGRGPRLAAGGAAGGFVTATHEAEVTCRGPDGEPVVTYRVTQDEGRPLAFDVAPARPGAAGLAAAAQALVTELPGWRVSAPTDVAERMAAHGATIRRRLRTMVRELAADPPPVGWAQAPLGGPAPSGPAPSDPGPSDPEPSDPEPSDPEPGRRRMVPCTRPAADLFPAWRAAYRPPHPDGFAGSDADALAERLVPLLAGAHGPVASWSRLVVDGDDHVVAGVVVLAAQPPIDMPWIGDVFRQPGPEHAGLGSALLQRVLSLVAADGVPQVGLSVTDGNPAGRVYERLGFRTTRSTATVEVP